MIPRRQFLGAVGATCLTAGSFAKTALASEWEADDLNWRCEVIKTIGQTRSDRAPVVTGVSLQPGGSLLAIVGDDHQVGIYDQANQLYVDHIGIHTDWIRATRFSPDGQILVTAGNDRTVRFWTTSDWETPLITKNHRHAIIEVAFANQRPWLATVGFEKTLMIYDARQGREVQQLTCGCKDNHAVAFSADDRLIAAGGRNGAIRVWDVASGKLKVEITPHRNRIRSLEFTPDGRLISAGDDQRVFLIDPQNPDQLQAFPRQAAKLYATAILGNDLLATAGSDNRIHIWQLATRQEIGVLKGHTGTVSSLDYRQGKLVSGSFDTTARLWQTESYTSAPQQRQTQLQQGWSGRIN